MKLQRDSNLHPLSGCGFELHCILMYRASFEQGVPWDIQATTECRFILKRVCDMIKTHTQKKMNLLICFKQVVQWWRHFSLKQIFSLSIICHFLPFIKTRMYKQCHCNIFGGESMNFITIQNGALFSNS